MRWYELAKIVHFMGLIALFGYFVTFARNAPRLRAATMLADVRTWLGVLMAARGMFHGGAGLFLLSGVAMVALRWRGPFPFATIGMVTLLVMWPLSVMVHHHLRRIHVAVPAGEGRISAELRTVILRQLPWALLSAMNGAALGILFVMTLKPGWLGAASTVLITTAIGGGVGAAAVGRQRALLPTLPEPVVELNRR